MLPQQPVSCFSHHSEGAPTARKLAAKLARRISQLLIIHIDVALGCCDLFMSCLFQKCNQAWIRIVWQNHLPLQETSLRSRRSVVCIITTNVAPHERLSRPNRRTRFDVGGRSVLQLYRSDAIVPRTHAWCSGRSSDKCSIRLIKNCSRNLIGRPVPRPDLFLSKERHRSRGSAPRSRVSAYFSRSSPSSAAMKWVTFGAPSTWN